MLMATTASNSHDECLVERDEVFFPQTDMFETEPVHQTIDGFIFNLIQIVEDIGYQPRSPFVPISSKYTTNRALCNLTLNLGGAHGSLVPIRRARIDREYFQRWYFEKYSRSASVSPSIRFIKKTTQKLDDHRSNNRTRLPVKSLKRMDEKNLQNHVLRMYGFDDLESISSTSSRRSSIDELTPVPSKATDNSKPKQQIIIREYYPSKDVGSLMVDGSIASSSSSSQQAIDDIDYEQFIADHPELCNDPNPEIITKPNPNPVTYQQNVSVRYLVPPTPPPPGPLIIREIIPPHPPTPPPLVIKHQDPAPPTPPPLILREAPPTPPPYQEPEIITKMLPQTPASSSPRVIIEQTPPLPAKPQSIIIEKWLPYKPPPPREIIYERVIEPPIISQFQPDDIHTNRPRRHSADLLSNSSTRLPIPVHIERQNSFDHLDTRQSSVFEEFARSTEQQLRSIQAHHQWVANQHQQHINLCRQLITPALIVHHPPVTRTVTSYSHLDEMLYQPTMIYPTYL